MKTVDSDGQFPFDDVAVGTFGAQVGPMKLSVHSPDKCAGRPCVAHSPSDHPMRDWRINYRMDLGFSERYCKHSIGHPDPDDLAWHKSQGREWVAIHSCDGCCRAPEEQ